MLRRQVLQLASAASPEMWTGRFPSALAFGEQFQRRGTKAAVSFRFQPNPQVVAGKGEGNEDRAPLIQSDSIALSADGLDPQLQLATAPLARPSAHKLLPIQCLSQKCMPRWRLASQGAS